jgi:hypothetical protein
MESFYMVDFCRLAQVQEGSGSISTGKKGVDAPSRNLND